MANSISILGKSQGLESFNIDSVESERVIADNDAI